MENIEKQLQQVSATQKDALVEHVLDLMKEGYRAKTSVDSKTKLSNLEIVCGNDTYKVHQDAEKSLSVSRINLGTVYEHEKFVDGKLSECVKEKGSKLIDDKFVLATGKIESETIKDGSLTNQTVFNIQSGKKVFSSQTDDDLRIYKHYDAKDGHVTSETDVEPNFTWGTTDRGRITFSQFDNQSGTTMEEMVFGDGKHYLTTSNTHSKKSSRREWNEEPHVIE